MKRAWAAGIAALVALAAVVGIAVGSGSGPPLRLAYVTGTATSASVVRLANADGTGARALGPGAQPLLAPDGSLVAASSGNALVVYPAGGGVPHRYFGAADASAVAVAVSPDSRYIAVILSSADPASIGPSGLAVIDTSTFGDRIVVRGQIDGASFAPDGSDRIAYASAASTALSAPVDVRVIGADGSGAAQITHDGRSLNPVWGPGGIAFDHERLRADAEPAYELWMMASDGSDRRPLSALGIPPLREGLVPVGFSDNGSVLLAEYEGEDTSAAWVLRLPGSRPTPLGAELTGSALSGDGTRALVDRGGFLSAPDDGAVESLPLHGGPPQVLVAHGSEPSWNG